MTPVLFPIWKSFALHHACLGWIGDCCSCFLTLLFDHLAWPTRVQLFETLLRCIGQSSGFTLHHKT